MLRFDGAAQPNPVTLLDAARREHISRRLSWRLAALIIIGISVSLWAGLARIAAWLLR